MTKAELIDKVANDTGLTKADAERVLNSITQNIAKCLKKNDKIALTGFGTFMVSRRKARRGVNPRTGDEIKIKSMKMARFKMGKELKDLLK